MKPTQNMKQQPTTAELDRMPRTPAQIKDRISIIKMVCGSPRTVSSVCSSVVTKVPFEKKTKLKKEVA